ncbi:MAG: aromatic ring-hydroxylating dioxygenase subunit alpha [Leptolyngbyaceae cyanobacterium bins.59]|nr:aromatic ring-hydroxylating dioxygenase subunit alpha [Leptolyngbyaceae cyanobacterium bins.59]
MGEKNFFLRDLWYFALGSARLKPGQMMAKTILGEPILLGRTLKGEAFALRDICPHRGVPLSCGRFDGNEVECCYHGWRFDSTGRCTDIPSLTQDHDLDLSLFGVRSYPLQEVQGNLWIYIPSSDRSDAAIPKLEVPVIPDLGDRSPDLHYQVSFPCFLDHAVVGLMDPAHGPFVHRVWWWRSRGPLFEKSKTFDPSPYGFTMRRHRLLKTSLLYRILGGVPEVEIIFRLPSVRIETVRTSRHILCNLTTLTPISETETEVNSLFYWTAPWLSPFKSVLRSFVQTFFEQDRSVVMKQQIGLKHNPSLMLIKDADTQAKWYYQLKSEYARSIDSGEPFVNPVKEQVLRWRS